MPRHLKALLEMPPRTARPPRPTKSRQRTSDVIGESGTPKDFASLLLPDVVLEGLAAAGFERPSPIQLDAIPLGRFGVDVVAQAKSGTGKTCVYTIVALEHVLRAANTEGPCVLVIVPTRELALQARDVVASIGRFVESLRVLCLIGGTAVADDVSALRKKDAHVVVGTPGRLKQMTELGHLRVAGLTLLVLDEADKLLGEGAFAATVTDIVTALPTEKQVMAFSATYPAALREVLATHTRDAREVLLCSEGVALKGVRQYICMAESMEEKIPRFLRILAALSFHQCLVFCNQRDMATELVDALGQSGVPAAFIGGTLHQSERTRVMRAVRRFAVRVLVSTDLTARGVDVERINLVVNFDIPRDAETFMHRVGRTGRFGSHGVALTLVVRGSEDEEELEKWVAEGLLPGFTDWPEDDRVDVEVYDGDAGVLDEEEQEQLDAFLEQESRGEAVAPLSVPVPRREEEEEESDGDVPDMIWHAVEEVEEESVELNDEYQQPVMTLVPCPCPYPFPHAHPFPFYCTSERQ